MPMARHGNKTIRPVVIGLLSVAVVAIRLLSVSRGGTATAATGNDSPAAPKENPDNHNDSKGRPDEHDGLWWKDNSAVIIAVLSVAVVAIRLLSVSRGDPETAYAILQAGGTGNVLIATLISTLGLLAIPICAALGLDAVEALKKYGRNSTRFHLSLAGSLAMLYIVFYMAPVGLLFLIVCLALSYALIMYLSWRVRRKLQRKEIHDTLFKPKTFVIIGICIYILILLVYEVGTPTPWLPVQKISVAGQRPFAGYVLSEANGETSILTSNPEEVIYLRDQSIQYSTQCAPPYYLEEQATIIELWEHYEKHKLVTYTACPSAPYSNQGLHK
jgi:hypothetical protein